MFSNNKYIHSIVGKRKVNSSKTFYEWISFSFSLHNRIMYIVIFDTIYDKACWNKQTQQRKNKNIKKIK